MTTRSCCSSFPWREGERAWRRSRGGGGANGWVVRGGGGGSRRQLGRERSGRRRRRCWRARPPGQAGPGGGLYGWVWGGSALWFPEKSVLRLKVVASSLSRSMLYGVARRTKPVIGLKCVSQVRIEGWISPMRMRRGGC
jgi:hypothetical protein